MIIATGAEYRRPALANLSQFEGAGVYYAAMPMEAQLCIGEEVIVVGGGNSAGQAAVFLAQTAKRVHMLVRARRVGRHDVALSHSPHRRQPRDRPAGRTRRSSPWKGTGISNGSSGATTEPATSRRNDIRHVFMMTGAVPNTGWLERCVVLDDKGFIKTGPDLSQDDLTAARWPLTRPPYLLETSRPGVFAVGDVRGGNIKRVASAVGEGSIAVAFVHQVLQS